MSLFWLIELLLAEFLYDWFKDPEHADLFNLLNSFSAGRLSTLLLLG